MITIAAADMRAKGAVESIAALLDQISALLRSLDDEQYARRPVGLVPSSIGGHVRHCLDHVEGLLANLSAPTLSYEVRARDTLVERDRSFALQRIGELRHALCDLADRDERIPLQLEVLWTAGGKLCPVGTTLGRELAFLLSHTIHHQALLSVMAKQLEIEVPADFGYAPSTLRHQQSQPCAR
ncbi:MAG: DinB family protein [Pirellulales bacterium]|nr:DinB family protein [Pirellulales bacterium]